MSRRFNKSMGSGKSSRREERRIREWEGQYPDTWILLEVTEQDDGEPVRGKLIATAKDPAELQEVWKIHRNKGVLTMLTYGPPLEPGPAVVVSAT
ncbi:MAG: hypothetical protein ACE5JU_23175 [Candidatus Binatia bacterium]